MEFNVSEWLNLFVRWFHVVAGITWIGQTYLFNAMEKWMHEAGPKTDTPNIAGELWMVHGGGFYQVEKQKVPAIMPRKLHWFKWEAALTWISGILLLSIVYYAGGLMVEIDSGLTQTKAICCGVGVLIGGWFAYDLLWSSPLARNEAVGSVISFILLLLLTYVLCHTFSGRAAYIHVGALMGTIMTANVWLRILPAQKTLIAAIQEGRPPNMALSLRGKRCSKHNTYMSVPLIFIMISNHFPTATYGSHLNWLILSFLIVLGGVAAKILRGSF